jgi:hypothetical protein
MIPWHRRGAVIRPFADGDDVAIRDLSIGILLASLLHD